MMATRNNSKSWWQVEIEDDSALSGAATASLLSLIAKKTGSTHAAVLSVEGAGERLSELQTEQEIVVPIERLLSTVRDIVQFDWADFFLADNEIQVRQIRRDEPYTKSLRKCLVLVRAVDDTYFYVYGTSPELREALGKAFSECSSKCGEPEDLDFPE